MMVKDNVLQEKHFEQSESGDISNVYVRKDLGDFCSVVCLKAIIAGLEDILGESLIRTNLILAGRIRGRNIARDMGLSKTDKSMSEWSALIANAIGKEGTRLCTLVKAEQQDDGIIRVYLSEAVCSAGEEQGSPRKLTFTQGAIQGAIEEITGRKLMGVQTDSVLRGQDYDVIEFRNR